MVRLNCTSGRSKPAAHLQWFINGEPADPILTRQYETLVTGREGNEKKYIYIYICVHVHNCIHTHKILFFIYIIFLKHYLCDKKGLETTTLGLEFRVRQRHFKKGDMKLKV